MRFSTLLFPAAFCTAILAAAHAVEQFDVFVSGQEGYHTYRIPAVIKAGNGSLLAFCEGRKSAGGDSGMTGCGALYRSGSFNEVRISSLADPLSCIRNGRE